MRVPQPACHQHRSPYNCIWVCNDDWLWGLAFTARYVANMEGLGAGWEYWHRFPTQMLDGNATCIPFCNDP